ncbi:MAG: hypothetical protein D3906_04365 [Candidatus Electrothrix sp. AUS1_2]|nr:hypothetical protein [Candidatus Electrothrix sp. AUS1_2]
MKNKVSGTPVDSSNFFCCPICGAPVEVRECILAEGGSDHVVFCSCGLSFAPDVSSEYELLKVWNKGLARDFDCFVQDVGCKKSVLSRLLSFVFNRLTFLLIICLCSYYSITHFEGFIISSGFGELLSPVGDISSLQIFASCFFAVALLQLCLLFIFSLLALMVCAASRLVLFFNPEVNQ